MKRYEMMILAVPRMDRFRDLGFLPFPTCATAHTPACRFIPSPSAHSAGSGQITTSSPMASRPGPQGAPASEDRKRRGRISIDDIR